MAGDSFYFDIRAEGTAVFLGPTEARLMELAWRQPSLTVKSALSHLAPKSGLAYTTVMTVLNRLVDKGLLTRSRNGRNFEYQAVTDRRAFVSSRLAEIRACLKRNFPSEFAEIG